MIKKVKIAILISGRGSNMKAIIDACKNQDYPAEVVLVLSNKQEAIGLQYASLNNITTLVIDHKKYKDNREEFDRAMHSRIQASGAQIICLAGFMRLLSPWFVNKWFNKIVNIHPSLLPDFKGSDAVGDALKAGVKDSGCTVHMVREEMDSGPIIMQSKVAILKDDDKENLAQRILYEENIIYPKALKIVCEKFLNNNL